jgi:hypothetical protein
MKFKRSTSRNSAQRCAWLCVTGLVLAGLSPASADELNIKDGAKQAGHTAGSVTRDIGQGAKTAGKEIGQGLKNVGKAIGSAVKEGGREFRRAVKGE